MRRKLFLAAAVAWSAIVAAPAWPQQAVFVVRHAERADGSRDSALSPAGQARAERLAGMLRVSGLGAIFVSELRRTAQTAAPVAQALHLTPVPVPSADIPALVSAVRAQPRDRVVLVVAHSHTIAPILKGLGYRGRAGPDIEDYDNLYVLVPGSAAQPLLLRLKY